MSYTVEHLDAQLEDLNTEDRLAKLQDMCAMSGIEFHHKNSEATLKKLLVDKYNSELVGDDEESDEESDEPKELGFKDLDRYPDESDAQYSARKRREAHKLIRVRVVCMNPSKKEWGGETFTFGNDVVGTIKRFVPFNVDTHIENVFLDQIKERKYQEFKVASKGGGVEKKEGFLVREFAIERLEPLSTAELKDLANQQAIANRIG